jgi:polyhydroxyalkanoate synthesis regulator phasin
MVYTYPDGGVVPADVLCCNAAEESAMSSTEETKTRNRAMSTAADMLASKKHVTEVTQTLCEKHNMSWNQAEEIVQEVQMRRKGAIARRQMPAKLFGAFVILLIGLVLVLLNGQLLEEYGLPMLFEEQLSEIELPFDLAFYGGEDPLQFFGGVGLGVLALLSALMALLPTLRR